MSKQPVSGVIGIGVDIIEVPRVSAVLQRHPDRFPHRVFTVGERDYSSRGVHAAERYAARYAAKEAVMKALGTGWSQGVTFRDIEVIRSPAGAPGIRLAGAARSRAKDLGVDRIDVSLSHCHEYAVAMVIMSGGTTE